MNSNTDRSRIAKEIEVDMFRHRYYQFCNIKNTTKRYDIKFYNNITKGYKKEVVNTLWIGDTLNELTRLAIKSWILLGYKVHLWIYDPVQDPLLDNENIDVDSLTGKTISYEVNKGAAIGKAVSPNLYLSLLSEYKIALPGSLQFSLRGEKYSGYGNYVNTYGIRKQDEISSIITMLTDNSKENYVAKLGMHPSAVGIATNMVALGVPLTDAVW